MDSRLPVTLRADGSLMIPSKKIDKISHKKLGHMIREGYEIKVKKNIEDGDSIDVTLETLIRIAMFPEPGDHHKKINAVQSAIETARIISGIDNLDTEVLYLIIENGGLENYMLRRAKGMVYERI